MEITRFFPTDVCLRVEREHPHFYTRAQNAQRRYDTLSFVFCFFAILILSIERNSIAQKTEYER